LILGAEGKWAIGFDFIAPFKVILIKVNWLRNYYTGFKAINNKESLVKVMSKSNYFELANGFYTDRPSLFTKLLNTMKVILNKWSKLISNTLGRVTLW